MTVLGYIRRTTVGTLQQFCLQSKSTYHRKNFKIFLQNASSFVPKRVLVVSKLTQYHYEKLHDPGLSEEEFKNKLLERGLNYESMLSSHCSTKNIENEVLKVLNKLNIKYKKVNRSSISRSDVVWADLILPIGGDGTFLLAANLIFDNKTPIIGINSSPISSEGYLMLPSYYTKNIFKIFELLKAGQYNVLMRSRIRTTLKGEGIWELPFHMHEEGRLVNVERFFNNNQLKPTNSDQLNERTLPWLALNETFVAEVLAAKISTLLIKFDDEENFYKVKSSGLCISTGTGSTAWYKSINAVSPHLVKQILGLVDDQKNSTDNKINQICTKFNNSLHFNPEEQNLHYVIRDMVITKVFPASKTLQQYNVCKKLTVRSLCSDGGLVLDGGIAVKFNLGTSAEFEIDPNTALQHFILPI